MTTSSQIQAVTDKYTLLGALDPATDEIIPLKAGDSSIDGLATQLYVWDTTGLEWVKMTQPIINTDTIEINNDALEALVEDTLQQYFMDDFDVSGNPIYVGYQRKDGYYYIQRFNTSTGAVDYTAGTSAYSTAWTNRATESYADFATTF